jgi:hypothetical protein
MQTARRTETSFVLYFASSCIPNVAGFSGLSILDCPLGFPTFITGITSLLGVIRVTKAVYGVQLILVCHRIASC